MSRCRSLHREHGLKYFAEIVAAIESFPYGGIQVKVIRTRLRQILRGVLLPVALVAALQVWLCKRRSRWLGLILPGLTLLASLLILLSMAAFTRVGASEVVYDAHGTVVEEHHAEHWEVPPGAELAAAGGVFLLANIPTVVLGGLWLHYKTRRDLREEMKRMDLQDLE